MSDSVWPHRRLPASLLCPWDSPGKNTGVGCHFLLQCRKVKSASEVAQSCPTLRDPMDCSLPGSSIHGIFQARVLEWGAIAFSFWDRRLKLNDVYNAIHAYNASSGSWVIMAPYKIKKEGYLLRHYFSRGYSPILRLLTAVASLVADHRL